MITIIASANMFGQSYLMTEGAPGTETRTAIYYIAETGLRNFQMGDAAAMSYVLTVCPDGAQRRCVLAVPREERVMADRRRHRRPPAEPRRRKAGDAAARR